MILSTNVLLPSAISVNPDKVWAEEKLKKRHYVYIVWFNISHCNHLTMTRALSLLDPVDL